MPRGDEHKTEDQIDAENFRQFSNEMRELILKIEKDNQQLLRCLEAPQNAEAKSDEDWADEKECKRHIKDFIKEVDTLETLKNDLKNKLDKAYDSINRKMVSMSGFATQNKIVEALAILKKIDAKPLQAPLKNASKQKTLISTKQQVTQARAWVAKMAGALKSIKDNLKKDIFDAIHNALKPLLLEISQAKKEQDEMMMAEAARYTIVSIPSNPSNLAAPHHYTSTTKSKAEMVLAFEKIYLALYAGQNSYLKTNFAATLIGKSAETKLKMITEHCSLKANSRTRKAWALAEKYDFDCSTKSLELLRDVYQYAFDKGSIFKRSCVTGSTFFKTESLQAHLNAIDQAKVDASADNSRTGLIRDALKT